MTQKDMSKTIDLSRYPLDRADGEGYRSLVSKKREELDKQQYCTMPGFLLDAARREIVAAVESRQQHTHRADSERNVYLERRGSTSLPDDHPKNILARGCYNMMGAHLLEDDSPLKHLYYWQPMQQFIADIVGETTLYPSADPYQPVNVLCQGDGDRSAWHFDSSNAFTMTLMLQAPESGGEFEMAPNTRSDTDPNYAGVAQLLLGDESRVVPVSRAEGELVIFRGCNSAHRVTPIVGNRRRLMCVMVYETEAGVIGDPVVNETVYGIKNSPA
ncbi:MAG: 2OG-Fe(II) oxygenase [Gammaproteobacteria bacterium]|nr:2OG-Fe(II) oxygenase [Gammaproteobacteria bacterium]